MILSRAIEHLRKQHWTAALIELAIVILGVFIGLQAQDWNAARQTAARAHVFSTRLLQDLRREAWGYEYLIAYNRDVLASARRVNDALTGIAKLPDEQFLIGVYRASNYKFNERHRATFDELISTGEIGLISDDKLRQTAESVYTNPLFDLIAREGKESDLRKVFRQTASAEIQHALLANCGDAYVEPGDFRHIKGSLDYPCSLGLPANATEAAAAALRSDPALLPAVRLRFADVETAIQDLAENNRVMLQNLRAVTGETAP
jgi:hypothetical protein